jgi:DNA-binding response OmpR family regulator
MATRVLLVDDDQKIISLLKRGLAYEGFEIYMGHLRQKLEASGGLRVIQTIRGVGYVLKG